MGGKDQHFSNLHMCRRTSSIEDNIGYIIARQRLDATIDGLCSLIIPMKAHVREIRLHQPWFHVGHSN